MGVYYVNKIYNFFFNPYPRLQKQLYTQSASLGYLLTPSSSVHPQPGIRHMVQIKDKIVPRNGKQHLLRCESMCSFTGWRKMRIWKTIPEIQNRAQPQLRYIRRLHFLSYLDLCSALLFPGLAPCTLNFLLQLQISLQDKTRVKVITFH